MSPLVDPTAAERSIGHIMAEAIALKPDEVERILSHQRQHGLRFGEAAVALGLAKGDDVMWALSQQFHYPYANTAQVDSGPLSPELVLAHKPFSAQAEVFRSLRSQINVARDSGPHRALAVLSPDRGDGRSYFAANLAIALSQLGGRTLLLDANLRQPRQHALFGLTDGDTGGLSSILAGRAEGQAIRAVPELPSLFVMPVGTLPPNPTELVERGAFAHLLADLNARFEHVIVDTPAATMGADAAVIAAHCKAALVLVRQNTTRAVDAQRLVTDLANGPAQVLGVVMNQI